MSAATSSIKPVYAVYGADAFRKRQVVADICKSVLEAGGDTPSQYEGKTAELAAVLDDVRTYSLLGGRRVVIVEDADEFISAHRAALERYCSEPVDSGVLILVCSSLPGNQRLHKIIAKNGQVTKCDALKRQEVVQWISTRAQEAHGKRLDARAAWMLREFTGDDLGMLDGEIGKLAIFVGERPAITERDIEALVGRHREENVFGVTDAIAEGDPARALAQWEQVLATDRAAPARAVGGLAWGIRRLLALKILAEGGASMAGLARQAFTRPDVLQRRLANVTVEELERQLCDLLSADLAAKSGLGSVTTAIEKFIITHSSRARPARRTG